jgi:hypothetical protein
MPVHLPIFLRPTAHETIMLVIFERKRLVNTCIILL